MAEDSLLLDAGVWRPRECVRRSFSCISLQTACGSSRFDEKSLRGVSSTQRLCANACRTSGQGGKTRVLNVVWRVVLSASDERIARIGRWKAFRSLGSCGVGAPRAEEVLAVRAGSGQPGLDWRVNGTSVVELSRLVQGLITPARVISGKPGIPRGGDFEAAAGAIGTKTDSPFEAGDAGNG